MVLENSASETWSSSCHVWIHVDFTSILHSLTPLVPQAECEANLDRLYLLHQWECLKYIGDGLSVSCVKWPYELACVQKTLDYLLKMCWSLWTQQSTWLKRPIRPLDEHENLNFYSWTNIFIWTLKIMRQMVTSTIWICWSSCIDCMFHMIWEVGVGWESIHLRHVYPITWYAIAMCGFMSVYC